MRMTGLNFESIPPLATPFRFYLTAPIFALIAAALLIDQGSAIWLSRWMPASLAITHLLALGVMGLIMVGSLFQVVPVLCGAPLKIEKWSLLLMHGGLMIGTLALSAAFLGWTTFLTGFALLALSLGYFVIRLVLVLVRQAQGEQTRLPIFFAAIALGGGVVIGLLLISNVLWGWLPTFGKSITNLHAGFGVFGWVLLLVMAVSFQVIPMFHVTPTFPAPWRIGLISMTLFGLFSLSMVTLLELDQYYAGVICPMVAVVYALMGIERLSKRKRKLPDAVVTYWLVGWSCLILGCVLIIAMPLIGDQYQAKAEVFVGLIIGLGFILGIIQGMLLKIVPFLITLHLQRLAMQNPAGMMLLPDHYQLISRNQGKYQFRLYLLVLMSIFGALFMPSLTPLLGVCIASNWLVIAYNISKATYVYRQVHKQMLASE